MSGVRRKRCRAKECRSRHARIVQVDGVFVHLCALHRRAKLGLVDLKPAQKEAA